MKLLSSGVSPATGLMALTRMPKGASSTAIDFVAVTSQPLLALYQVRRGRGLTAAVEATLRMAPARADLNSGTKAFAVLNTARMLTPDDAVEVGVGHLLHRHRQVRDAGIVDEDVGRAEGGHRRLGHRVDALGAADIDLMHDGVRAELGCERRRPPRR